MKIELIIDRIEKAKDMIPLFVGSEDCAPCHSYGPHIRDYYIIHYCLSGRGVLKNKHADHNVEAGELFIIRPGEVTVYTADRDDPWSYVWIAFKGERANVFSSEQSVFSCSSEPFMKIKHFFESEDTSSDIYTSILYDIIHRLFSPQSESPDILLKIKKYIRYNYMMDIRAEGVARAFGYERTYLYRIFKKRYGLSIKEYIIKVRMENARAFLEAKNTVCDTARLVGYADEFNFSRAYKHYYGYPPSKTARNTNTASQASSMKLQTRP